MDGQMHYYYFKLLILFHAEFLHIAVLLFACLLLLLVRGTVA